MTSYPNGKQGVKERGKVEKRGGERGEKRGTAGCKVP